MDKFLVTSSINNRLLYLDSARGFAVFLMVFAHSIAWCFDDYQSVLSSSDINTSVAQVGLLWEFIYSFHMSLLFLISGYLTYRTGKVLKRIQRKTIRLLIPYFATGSLITIIRPGFGYWFLFSLWELSLLGIAIFSVIDKLNKRKIIWVDMILNTSVNFYR